MQFVRAVVVQFSAAGLLPRLGRSAIYKIQGQYAWVLPLAPAFGPPPRPVAPSSSCDDFGGLRAPPT